MTKPTVLIHVDDRRRDALVCVLLSRMLEEMGNRVYLCNRMTSRLYWTHLQPDVMVQPYVWMGVGSHEELAHRARRTRIVTWPTEGMVATDEEFVRDYARAYDPAIVLSADVRRRYTQHLTKALLWGEASKRALVEGESLEESQVALIGCPRLDFFHPDIPRPKGATEPGPTTVGFVGGFPPVNVFDQRSVFQTIDGLRAPHARGTAYDEDGGPEDVFWWYYAGARLYIDLLDEWVEKRGGTAFYRPHPFEFFGSYAYLERKYGERFVLDDPLDPFPDWMASVRALVINRSTSTILPALIRGMPVLTVQEMIRPQFAKFVERERYNTGFVDQCYKPKTIAEATELLQAAVQGDLVAPSLDAPDFAALLRDQVDWPRQELALSSSAREIDRIAKEAVDGRKRSLSFSSLKGKGLPFALRAGLKWRSLRGKYSSGRQQEMELSMLWPWHRYEQQVGDRMYREMRPKMMADLETAGSAARSAV